MRAGRRVTQIEIYASTETTGDSGDPQPSWETTPTWTVWACKRIMSANEETVAAARQSFEDVVFDIGYIDGVTPQHKIVSGGVDYDITAVRDPDGRQRSLLLYAASGKRYGA